MYVFNIYIYVCEINCHTCISIRTYVYIISGKLPTCKSNPFRCHEFHSASSILKSIWIIYTVLSIDSCIYLPTLLHLFSWCFEILAFWVASCCFPPLPRPHLIPPMAAGCLGCGPQWPPKISCPGWHLRRHSHQETSENLRSKFFDVVHGGTSWHLYGKGTYITIYYYYKLHFLLLYTIS